MKTNHPGVTRRAALKQAFGAVAGAAAATATPVSLEAQAPAPVTASRRVVASDAHTVVETTAGKIRGYSNADVLTFKGVPYAEPASGERRFMPPVKVRPWTDTRNALQFGPTCPTGIADPRAATMPQTTMKTRFCCIAPPGAPAKTAFG